VKVLLPIGDGAVADTEDELLDVPAPLKIAQKFLGVVPRLEIPLLPFTMLMTELAHRLVSSP
jgi:hypothetical protein